MSTLAPSPTPAAAQQYTLNLLWLFSSDGGLQTIADYPTALKLWQQRLNSKQADSTWPFLLNIIVIDLHSNITLLQTEVIDRYMLNATAVSSIHAVMAPEDFLAFALAPYTDAAQIPMISATANSNNEFTANAQPAYSHAFFLLPPPSAVFKSMQQAFVTAGIRSVAYITLSDDHDQQSCQNTAQQLQSQGVQLLKSFTFPDISFTDDQVTSALTEMRDVIKPDLLLYCNWQICFSTPGSIMQLFQSLQYMPPGLSILDCLQVYQTFTPEDQMLYMHTVSAEYTVPLIAGLDYTEDDTSYSSQFRPPSLSDISAQSLTSLLNNVGIKSLASGAPSSTALLQAYWFAQTGVYAAYPTVALWAGVDVLEAAFYHSATLAAALSLPNITTGMVYDQIEGRAIGTPFGRVAFDSTHVNFGFTSFLTQATAADTPVILPNSLAQAQLVYPAPTWAERVYTPKYMQTDVEHGMVAFAAVVSIIMMIICVTVYKQRQDPGIRMLHYFHMQLQAVAASLICLTIALVWTVDTTASSCAASWWLLYTPLSFMIWMKNIKAYRLSTFLRNVEWKQRKFPHSKVLKLTALWMIPTVAALIIAVVISPPQLHTVVVDPLRPAYNYHTCVGGITSTVILIVMAVFHVLASVYCIFAVRNGVDGFRDGVSMKEAFFLLYIFLILAYGMSQAPLTNGTLYALRAGFVIAGIFIFLARMWSTRLATIWLSAKTIAWLEIKYKQLSYVYNRSSINHVSTISHTSILPMTAGDPDSPVYPTEQVDSQTIDGMWKALRNPTISKEFCKFADSNYNGENIMFCDVVDTYKEQYMSILEAGLKNTALPELSALQAEIFAAYIRAGGASEINISSMQRADIERQMKYMIDQPSEVAGEIMRGRHGQQQIFGAAKSEVAAMLYQNLWSRFRAHMTGLQLMDSNISTGV